MPSRAGLVQVTADVVHVSTAGLSADFAEGAGFLLGSYGLADPLVVTEEFLVAEAFLHAPDFGGAAVFGFSVAFLFGGGSAGEFEVGGDSCLAE